MKECKFLKGCSFFNDKMPINRGVGALYKKRYCQGGEWDKCARYKIATALGRDKVPVDLYPNMFEAAENIIKKEKS